VSEPELIASSDPADVLGSGDRGIDDLRAGQGGQPGERRPRVVALWSAIAVTVAVCVAGWWGGSTWQSKQATAADNKSLSVSLALLRGDAGNPGDLTNVSVAWSALLVNTGPVKVVVESGSWGRTPIVKVGPLTLKPKASAVLMFSSPVSCPPDLTSPLPAPPATDLVLRGPDGRTVHESVPMLNPTIWSGVLFDTCNQVAGSGNAIYPNGDYRSTLVGTVLMVKMGLVHQGGAAPIRVTLGFQADGLAADVTPKEITLPPDGAGTVTIRLQVLPSECVPAATGAISGLTIGGDSYGVDTDLIRAIDRLVAASCPR
jgi:hypothetical protein